MQMRFRLGRVQFNQGVGRLGPGRESVLCVGMPRGRKIWVDPYDDGMAFILATDDPVALAVTLLTRSASRHGLQASIPFTLKSGRGVSVAGVGSPPRASAAGTVR